jgi:hypothetical protein
MRLIGLHYGSSNVLVKDQTGENLVWQALYSGDVDVISVVDHDVEVFSLVEYGGITWKVVSVDEQMCCVQLAPVGVSGED